MYRNKLNPFQPAAISRTSLFVASWMAICCFAAGQDMGCPGAPIYQLNQEAGISNPPMLTAPSKDASDVLATSLAISFNDPAVCCGKNSALVDRVSGADPKSLEDVAKRLLGRQLTSDGLPIMISAKYLAASATQIPDQVIGALMEKHALLMRWKSNLYVVYGVIYDLTIGCPGGRTYAIRKLLLLDTQFSDKRREVSFDRQTDDWGEVQGLLIVKAAPK